MEKEVNFELEMNDPIIVIDKEHIPTYLRHVFSLWIHNTSDATLYFKIVEQIPNWTLKPTSDIPSDGKLGAIAAGVSKHFVGTIDRYLPSGESEDVGNFVVGAYVDAGYTNLLESHSHPTTIYIDDLESWSNVQKSDFDDGSSQGWTLGQMAISGEQSVEVGGCSARGHFTLPGTYTVYLSKSIALPNTDKVRLSFYWFWSIAQQAGPYSTDYKLKNLVGYLNGTKLYDCLKSGEHIIDVHVDAGQSKSGGWFKGGFDLSSYKGQTKTIKIQVDMVVSTTGYPRPKFYFDNIVIAGKN